MDIATSGVLHLKKRILVTLQQLFKLLRLSFQTATNLNSANRPLQFCSKISTVIFLRSIYEDEYKCEIGQ